MRTGRQLASVPVLGVREAENDRRLLRACWDLTAERPPQLSFAGEDAFSFRQMIAAHGLGGLALEALENNDLVLPESVIAGMASDWATARRWCLALDHECARLGAMALEHARAQDLAFPLLVKGRSVAVRYRDPALRTYVDVDMLVPVNDFDGWVEFLVAQGYYGPVTELAPTRRRHQHSIALGRPSPEGVLGCDLHTCLFVERTARNVTYQTLAVDAGPSEFPGINQPSPPAQLLVLALHFVQHVANDRRLIWARDFIELGDATSVAEARALARAHGVEWAIESALAATEEVLGQPVWNAAPGREGGGGQAAVHRLDGAGYLHHIALTRELGVGAGLRYLVSRIDPRRFRAIDGSIDWPSARAWVKTAARRARATPWRSWRHAFSDRRRKGPGNPG